MMVCQAKQGETDIEECDKINDAENDGIGPQP